MDNLNNPLNTVGLDVSPAILIPYYDEDSSTLFLTGRVRSSETKYFEHIRNLFESTFFYDILFLGGFHDICF